MHVLLVDDHPLILNALATVVQGLEEDVRVTGVSTGNEAREVLAQRNMEFELVLLDLHLSDTEGFSLLREFHRKYPGLRLVVVSAADSKDNVDRALKEGAMGFVPKRSSNQVLLDALRQVRSGTTYVPEANSGLSEPSRAAESFGALRADVLQSLQLAPNSLAGLGITPRQYDTLICLIKGKSNKAIARELGISAETVKNHVNAIMRALGVDSRLKIAVVVSRLVDLGEKPWVP